MVILRDRYLRRTIQDLCFTDVRLHYLACYDTHGSASTPEPEKQPLAAPEPVVRGGAISVA